MMIDLDSNMTGEYHTEITAYVWAFQPRYLFDVPEDSDRVAGVIYLWCEHKR